jgi:carbon storage regulator
MSVPSESLLSQEQFSVGPPAFVRNDTLAFPQRFCVSSYDTDLSGRKTESIDGWSLDAVSLREGVLKMLVLSRQRDESIIIGDNIVITIVDIRGDKVRLGIEAPKEVPVHRQEVYEAIQRERTQSESGEKVADDSTSPST